jgi:hypothetical protein
VAALLAADLSPLKIAVLMVDGVHVADHCCVVAFGITAAGTKVLDGALSEHVAAVAVSTRIRAGRPTCAATP